MMFETHTEVLLLHVQELQREAARQRLLDQARRERPPAERPLCRFRRRVGSALVHLGLQVWGRESGRPESFLPIAQRGGR
ncbi:MAG: hypothetical protein WAM30_07915 [Candidatus Dormiibacterota bacterium]